MAACQVVFGGFFGIFFSVWTEVPIAPVEPSSWQTEIKVSVSRATVKSQYTIYYVDVWERCGIYLSLLVGELRIQQSTR